MDQKRNIGFVLVLVLLMAATSINGQLPSYTGTENETPVSTDPESTIQDYSTDSSVEEDETSVQRSNGTPDETSNEKSYMGQDVTTDENQNVGRDGNLIRRQKWHQMKQKNLLRSHHAYPHQNLVVLSSEN